MDAPAKQASEKGYSMAKRSSGNKPEEKIDLRIRRTKKSIRDAFFELISEKGFDSVTVKDITDRALISRNTFYLHYEDKFDLLNKISNELMRKVYLRVSKDLLKVKNLDFTIDCTAMLLISIQRVIDEDRELYRLLLTDPGTVVFADKIEKTIRTALDLIKGDIEGISDLSIEYIITGMKGVIRYWVTHDNMDVQTEAYNFARIHLGSILEIIRHSKDVKHGRIPRESH